MPGSLPSRRARTATSGLRLVTILCASMPCAPFHGSRLAASRLVRAPIHALLAARDGALWIGTHSGLIHRNGQRLVPNERTAGQLITDLFEDREGKIWASTGAAWVCRRPRGDDRVRRGSTASLATASARSSKIAGGSEVSA